MNMGPDENDKMCHVLYKCNQEDLKQLDHDEVKGFIKPFNDEAYQALNQIVNYDRRKRRSPKGLLFGRPFRKPTNSLGKLGPTVYG